MKHLKQNAKIMLLLIAASMLTFHADARHKVSKRAKKHSTVSVVSNENASPAETSSVIPEYKLSQEKGKITVSDGVNKTVISNDPNDVQALVNKNEVYYIKKAGEEKNTGSSIYVFNMSTKANEDIIKQNAVAANYDTKNEIGNIILDKKSNKLFFSTAFANKRGQIENQTWKYDINTKQLEVYKDGAIESIDAAGNQVIVFHGIDSKGQYTSRSIINASGQLQSVIGKQYDLISSNK